MAYVISTNCCSLCHISCSDADTKGTIAAAIKSAKATQRKAVFCVAKPTEDVLAANLEELGFKMVLAFNRCDSYHDIRKNKLFVLEISELKVPKRKKAEKKATKAKKK